MSTKYNEFKNKHNISGVILPQIRYGNIYGVGPFPIPLIVSLYDTSIAINATRIEVHRDKVVNKSKCNGQALYNTANTGCANFIMSVVEDMWFK